MKYLSVFSGIEAATVAWHPLGWKPFAFAENGKFPSAVLKHHYPSIPNLGDITKFKDWPDADIDVLVGGSPCQSFSVAGLRKGLADPRGNLSLTYLGCIDRYRPEWFVWENVPGVMSLDDGRAFGSILGGMAELGYGWAYRVIDAQFVRVDGFGRAVPQRRRRVFVVGNSGGWRRAAAVFFERESLSWDSAPRRQAGQGASADVAPSIVSSGRGVERAGDTRGQDPVIAVSTSGDGFWREGIGPLRGREQDSHENLVVAHSLRADGFDASEDGTGRGTPLVPIAFDCKAGANTGFAIGDLPGALRGQGHGGGHAAIAFSCKDHGADAGSIASPIIPIAEIGASFVGNNTRNHGTGVGNMDDPMFALGASKQHAVAFNMRRQEAQTWQVRRLTPIECERLQGFPDEYTNVPWRGKNGAPDGPRYKALGNSMAVNCMRWIGTRIQMVSDIANETAQAAE